MRVQLNIRELCAGYPVNLRYVQRFSTSRVLRPENVAEHSYFVTLYAFLITKWLAINEDTEAQAPAFLASVLSRAVIHDLEEARTGDIHRPFKYSHPGLKEALGKASEIAISQVLEPLWQGEDYAGLTEAKAGLAKTWQVAKAPVSKEGRIVAFADYLSVLSFVMQEGKDAPERLCLDSMLEHFSTFRDPSFAFLAPLVEQAAELTGEVFNVKGI